MQKDEGKGECNQGEVKDAERQNDDSREMNRMVTRRRRESRIGINYSGGVEGWTCREHERWKGRVERGCNWEYIGK